MKIGTFINFYKGGFDVWHPVVLSIIISTATSVPLHFYVTSEPEDHLLCSTHVAMRLCD
jgi:hypothetical protein